MAIRFNGANNSHIMQCQAYMALYNLKSIYLCYCLVPYPESQIKEYINHQFSLYENSPIKNNQDLIYIKTINMERKLRNEDINTEEKVVIFKIERDTELIKSVYDVIRKCRDFVSELDKNYINKITLTAKL